MDMLIDVSANGYYVAVYKKKRKVYSRIWGGIDGLREDGRWIRTVLTVDMGCWHGCGVGVWVEDVGGGVDTDSVGEVSGRLL